MQGSGGKRMTEHSERDDKVDADDRKPSKLWTIGGAAVLLLGVGVFFGLRMLGGAPEGGQAEETVPVVEVVSAEAEGRRYTVSEEGFLRPLAEIAVTAEMAGRVEEVSEALVAGGRIEEGEPLFRLDDREVRAQLQQAEADLQSARAQLSRIESDASRQERLAEIGAAPVSRAEQARSDLAGARAGVSQAEAQLEIARERLDDTVVRAPFSATVQSESLSVGSYVTPGEVVARIYDNTAARGKLGMSPDDAGAVRRAQRASDAPLEVAVSPTAASASTLTLIGTVEEIGTALDPQARTVTVTVRVEDAFAEENAGLVYANDFMEATLPALSPIALYAAPSGVLRKDAYVWTVEAGGEGRGELSRVEVTPIKQQEDRVVFSSEGSLADAPLLLTALTEEVEGLTVRVAPADGEQRLADRQPESGSGR